MITKILRLIGSTTINGFNHLKNRRSKEYVEEENFIDDYNLKKEVFTEIINNKPQKNKIQIRPILIIFLIIIGIITVINIQISLYIIVVTVLIISIIKVFPKIKEENRKKDIIKNLPFALRQITIQLKAGIGLYDALKEIANNENYGELSKEFQITLEEIHYGTSNIEAFKNLSKRVNKPIMTKVVNQIIRTLNNGGNLANTLNLIANESTSNMKIKYKEYSEKLNSLMLLYMFIAVLIPVILFVMIIAATTVMGAIIKPELILILYLLFFPMVISFMILLIKRMEPTLE